MIGFLLFITRGGQTDPHSGARYLCEACHAHLADAADVVSVLSRPPRRVYTNPQGWACDLVTLAHCREEHLAASLYCTTEHTWFEGYAWRPLGCSGCGTHVGWRFEAAGDSVPPDPTVFFGLLMDRLLVD